MTTTTTTTTTTTAPRPMRRPRIGSRRSPARLEQHDGQADQIAQATDRLAASGLSQRTASETASLALDGIATSLEQTTAAIEALARSQATVAASARASLEAQRASVSSLQQLAASVATVRNDCEAARAGQRVDGHGPRGVRAVAAGRPRRARSR